MRKNTLRLSQGGKTFFKAVKMRRQVVLNTRTDVQPHKSASFGVSYRSVFLSLLFSPLSHSLSIFLPFALSTREKVLYLARYSKSIPLWPLPSPNLLSFSPCSLPRDPSKHEERGTNARRLTARWITHKWTPHGLLCPKSAVLRTSHQQLQAGSIDFQKERVCILKLLHVLTSLGFRVQLRLTSQDIKCYKAELILKWSFAIIIIYSWCEFLLACLSVQTNYVICWCCFI